MKRIDVICLPDGMWRTAVLKAATRRLAGIVMVCIGIRGVGNYLLYLMWKRRFLGDSKCAWPAT